MRNHRNVRCIKSSALGSHLDDDSGKALMETALKWLNSLALVLLKADPVAVKLLSFLQNHKYVTVSTVGELDVDHPQQMEC